MEKLFINGAIDSLDSWYKKDAIFYAMQPLKVYIDSPGGSVTDGNSLAALLRDHAMSNAVEVETVGVGLVASIATSVLLAGTKVKMDKDALFMIHNPSADFVSGDAKDLRSVAAALDVVKNQLLTMYVNRIKKAGKLKNGSEEETRTMVANWMNNETWFTAQEALDYGFIDEIHETKEEEKAGFAPIVDDKAAQRLGGLVAMYKNAPVSIKNQYKTMQNVEEKKGFFSALAKFFGFGDVEFKNESVAVVEPVAEATPEIEEQQPVAEVQPEPEPVQVVQEVQMSEADAIEMLKKGGYEVVKATETETLKNSIATLQNEVKTLQAELAKKQAAPAVPQNVAQKTTIKSDALTWAEQQFNKLSKI